MPQQQKTFDGVFDRAEPAIAETARRLRGIIQAAIPDLEETISGGSKVQLVLYSHGGANRVVCGMQPAAAACMFYLHRIQPEDVPEYKLEGQGKHAKHIKLKTPEAIDEAAIERAIRLSWERLPATE